MISNKSASWFTRFANAMARWSGRPVTFGCAVLLIVAWAVSGPIFGYSDTWQLAINTSTTIITFLMVFLIQNTQNRDAHAMQIKLDELIRSTEGAHNALLDLEELEVEDIERVLARYSKLAKLARAELERGGLDTGTKAGEDELREEGRTPSTESARRRRK
jgi:low affinity Fe/Cu permease